MSRTALPTNCQAGFSFTVYISFTAVPMTWIFPLILILAIQIILFLLKIRCGFGSFFSCWLINEVGGQMHMFLNIMILEYIFTVRYFFW